MQVVPSQRLSLPLNAPPLSLYRALRNLNPSPYMYFLDLDGFEVIGSSPEILVRLEEGLVTVRPIAGTRRRGATEEEDQALEAELLTLTYGSLVAQLLKGPLALRLEAAVDLRRLRARRLPVVVRGDGRVEDAQLREHV